MSELAKSHIEIIDDSSYGAGTSAIIPLYVFATEQNKVIDETTGEIAPGTTKAVANEVIMLTSRKDVTDTYGVPQFTTVNGTVQQGDELNEVGLYGLYDALGNSSLAYAIRADIDLKELQPKESEPKGKVENQSLWFDMSSSEYGLFISNGNDKTRGWDRIEQVKALQGSDLTNENKPVSSYGKEGTIVAVYDSTASSEGLKFYEKFSDNSWEIIGSSEWKAKKSDLDLYFASHTNVPDSKEKQGAIWMKTTEPNYGAKIIMKQYVASSDSWVSSTIPVYGSFVDAEYNYGPMLNAGSKILKYESTKNSTNEEVGEAILKFYRYKNEGLATLADNVGTIESGKSFTVRNAEILKTNNKIIEITTTGNTLESLVNDFNLATKDIKSLTADIKDNHFRIISDAGYSYELADGENSSIIESLYGSHTVSISNWEDLTFKASIDEPTASAEEGTLWFNDDLNIDIMVNDGGTWKGYNNVYSIVGETQESITKPEIFVTSEEPIQRSTGNALCENDLWINTAAINYPEIHRYYDNKWELVDNTDQTTPLGIIFADARYYADKDGTEPTFEIEKNIIKSNLLDSDYIDPDCPNPQSYPSGMLLFNTRFSTNNVKEYKENPFVGLYNESDRTYSIGGGTYELTASTARWVSSSGNANDGSGLFGRKAQRAMIVKALAKAINSNEDIRSNEYDFFYACCPGYPELDDEFVKLNTEKKEMFYIVSDTPARLKPRTNDITAWATNKNNTPSHGEDGRIIQSAYMTRQYPPMGLTSNVDGSEITIPTSIAKMKNLLLLPRGMFAAGTQYGQVKNLASVGYITNEEEYNPVVVREGLGEVIVANKMNPIMPQRNTGLLFWGENTENQITSSLSDEHAILTLLRLKRELDEACLPFFFKPNTEALRKDFDATLRSILNDYVGREELYDYVLVTDRSVNTPERIERKELWAEIAIEIIKGVEQIYIPIRIVKTGSLSNINS